MSTKNLELIKKNYIFDLYFQFIRKDYYKLHLYIDCKNTC